MTDDMKPKPIRPIPKPRKSVRQMVKKYEENIILPPPEFRDKPVPAPRKLKPIIPPPEFRDRPVPLPRKLKPSELKERPVAVPRTKIERTNKALKGYTESFEVRIKNDKNPVLQLQNTRKAVEYHIIRTLALMKGLKFV